MDVYLKENVEYLALYRKLLAAYKAELKVLQEEFNQRPDIANLKQKVKDFELLIEQFTDAIKSFGVELYPGTPDHPAVKTKEMSEVTIDEVAALEWAKVNMPVAIIISIDEKMLTEYAKQHPVPWATVKKVPQVTISTDLSKYLLEQA